MRYLFLALASTALLAGCGDSDDDQVISPPPNNRPVAMDASYTTQTDVAFTESFMASDEDGDALTFSLTGDMPKGSVVVNGDGTFTYTPPFEQTGSDAFMFTVSDGSQFTASATVNITIEVKQESFTDYSISAYQQSGSAMPLSVNGRAFTQDATSTAVYADLVASGSYQGN